MSSGFGLQNRSLTHIQFALILFIVVEILFLGVIAAGKLGGDDESQVKDASTSQRVATDGPRHTTQSLMPPLRTDIVLANRSFITDIDFLPTSEMLFTERRGALNIVRSGQTLQLGDVRDVKVVGASGLLGVAVDPAFASNRFVYSCYNSTHGDMRVSRWAVAPNLASMMPSKDIITGLPAASATCDISFGADGKLWVDAGKRVIRSDRDGTAVADTTDKYPELKLAGSQWQKWNGAVVTTVPSDQYLRVRAVDTESNISAEERILRSGFGQLQTVVQGLDGGLYVGTGNGGDDKIIRVSPEL